MKCRVKWLDHMTFVGESASGHAVVMDAAPESGGRNMGVRPMEMLLLGLGGCTAFDVVMILKKSRQDIVDCEVTIDSDRAQEVPKVFTRIHIHFIVSGKKLDAVKVDKAVNLSADKYCSASKMLSATADITHDFEIVELG
ncbi:MAG: OsmC family protein [Gammaproteobacteria bacterium]|nr:OsmC family protein [Gammaproteobacteria bacterium]MCZ6882111.1 OsmC family protein [Gammaproteobacteria bacterium]